MLLGDAAHYLTLLVLAVHGARPDQFVQVSVQPSTLQKTNATSVASFTQLQASVESKDDSTGVSAQPQPALTPEPLVWHWIPKNDDKTPFNAFYAIQHHLQSTSSKCWGWHAADAYDVMHHNKGMTALEDFMAAVPRDGEHNPLWQITLVCKAQEGVVFSLGLDWKHKYNALTNQHPKFGFHVWHRLQLPRSTTSDANANGASKEVFAKLWHQLREDVIKAAPGANDPAIKEPPSGDATDLAIERFEKEKREQAHEEIEARKLHLLRKSPRM